MGRTSPISGRALGLAGWLATVGGVGFFPLAPGTAGSAVAVLLFLLTCSLGLAVHLLLVLCVTLLGVWSSGASEAVFGRADDGRIVIDEVAGQWIALAPLFAAPLVGIPFWGAVVTAFVAFRVFDVWKPGPVGWAERHFRGGLGVMADDCVAGVLAALVVAVPVLLRSVEAGG